MTDRGKVDRSFFAQHVAPRLGAAREDVGQGPAHGVDFATLDLGETGLALATDPISVLPGLGFGRAGRFALHIVLSDVAVSGHLPTHLAISLALPESTTTEQFDALWGAIDEECRALGTSIVTGHTAQYPGSSYPWVGAATAMAVCDPGNVVRPDGARPGDRLLVTRGPAVETTGLFASLYPEELGERGLDADTVAEAAQRLEEVRLVRDAVTAAEVGHVTAMHDATEGGLLGAFSEMAASAGVRFEVTADDIPIRPGVEPVCDALGVDPWAVTTAGTLVIAVAPEDSETVITALEARGTPVGVAGDVADGSGVSFRGEEWTDPPRDPSWDAYADLAGE
ncbi:MAG: AIR synthase family protein [Halolamina sp.]|uniref:AIR synthase family protein n=1 Tax=Halolamina sp. TaxID=1940283 RepID=UPI002FC2D0DC